MRALSLLAIGAWLAVPLTACSRKKAVCVPGASVECACVDGSKGSQSCADDGQSYHPCTCAPTVPVAASVVGLGQAPDAGQPSPALNTLCRKALTNLYRIAPSALGTKHTLEEAVTLGCTEVRPLYEPTLHCLEQARTEGDLESCDKDKATLARSNPKCILTAPDDDPFESAHEEVLVDLEMSADRNQEWLSKLDDCGVRDMGIADAASKGFHILVYWTVHFDPSATKWNARFLAVEKRLLELKNAAEHRAYACHR